ncbi:Gaa1-domain-containing protein [Amanita rubescens]|nr:Gaa1-domain-containing protein [Amanita rubescens]
MDRLRSRLVRLTLQLKSHEIRIRRRRALVSWLTRRATILRVVLFCVGYLWMISLPSPRLGRGTYIDENALQPAQVNTYWNWQEVHNADRYLDELERLRDTVATSEQRARFFEAEFAKLGISSSTQRYSYSNRNNATEGINSYAVLSSPRASGTEAMVISASWISRMDDGHVSLNLRGVSTVLALAAFLKNYSLWAKDIVFVISDGYLEGMHAWLSAYHGNAQANLHVQPLNLSSGIIWTALNIDYPGHSFSHLGMFYEGCNGRLPNQDLQNSFHRIALSNGVPVTVYDHVDTADHNKLPPLFNRFSGNIKKELEEYQQRAKNILRHVGYQARGRPSGVHGLYHQFRIDAITLFAVPATGPHGFHSIGRVVESTLRTMNNLIERLHASFFFFILTAPDRFLKIGSYLPSALLVSVAMMFGGLKAWNDASLPTATKDTKNIQPKTREVLSALIIMAYTHILGALLFWFLTSSWYSDKSHVISAATFAAVAFSVVPIARQFPDANASSLPLTLKSFNLCMASTAVSITAMLNFSLASTLALLLGIPLSISSPSKPAASLTKRVIRFVPYAVLALGWLFLATEVEQALWHWNFLSVWFAPFVCIVYMPLVLQAGLVCLL